jgi:HSP20 family protein
MRKEDIEVEMTDGILYVKGQRQHEPEVGEGMPLVLERQCGGFARHFHLHSDVLSEGIRADYSAGILKVTIPKSPKSQSRTVPIHVS